MAKAKKPLVSDWFAIDPDALPDSAKPVHQELRDAFELAKQIKAKLEPMIVVALRKIDVAKGKTKEGKLYSDCEPGTPERLLYETVMSLKAGNVAKFSYMRGIAVATDRPAKSRTTGTGYKLTA